MRLNALAITAIVSVIAGCSLAPSGATRSVSEPQVNVDAESPLDPRPLASPETLVVSTAGDFEVFSALYAADILGEFEKENLAIEYVTLPSPEALPALALGQVDVSAVGVSSNFFNAVAEGAPIKMVFPGPSSSEGDGLWVRTAWLEAESTASDITVANSQGGATLGAVPILDWASERGLDSSMVTFERLPIGELAGALDMGLVDAAWLNSPAHLPFLQDGSAQLVAEYSDGQTAVAYAFGSRLLVEQPEVGLAFVRALLRAQMNWLAPGYKAKEDVVEALAERLGESVEELRQTGELEFLTEFDTSLFDRGQERWLAVGDILAFDSPLAPELYIDTQWIAELSSRATTD